MSDTASSTVKSDQRSWLVFAGSLLVCIFWICCSQFNMYRYTLTGVLVEMAWFPFIALTLIVLVLACIGWVKQKFRIQSLYLLSILLIAATITFISLL